MKRFLFLCALAGALPFAAVAAASATEPVAPDIGVMVPTSGSPPVVTAVRVQAPTPSLQRVTVRSGDTLSGIGARTHRSWPALASYNRIPNPNLIFVGQTVVIPPASYVPPAVTYTAPVVPSYRPPPVTQHSTRSYTPQRTYRGTRSSTYSAPRHYVSSGGGIWACIGQHESGNNPATNTGNGYYGAFQDTISAWRAGGGGPGLPSNYSYSEQLRVNQNLQAQVGWGAWPNTSRVCGA